MKKHCLNDDTRLFTLSQREERKILLKELEIARQTNPNAKLRDVKMIFLPSQQLNKKSYMRIEHDNTTQKNTIPQTTTNEEQNNILQKL